MTSREGRAVAKGLGQAEPRTLVYNHPGRKVAVAPVSLPSSPLSYRAAMAVVSYQPVLQRARVVLPVVFCFSFHVGNGLAHSYGMLLALGNARQSYHNQFRCVAPYSYHYFCVCIGH